MSTTSISQLSDGTDALAGLTLVSTSNGDFVIVSSGADLSGSGIVGDSSAISLSFDDATQFLLQQQQEGITQAVELPDGTFQLLKSQTIKAETDSEAAQGQTLHIQVLQALHGELQPAMDTNYSLEEVTHNLEASSPAMDIKSEPMLTQEASDSPENSMDYADMEATPDGIAGLEDDDEAETLKEKMYRIKESKKVVKRELTCTQPDLNCPIPLSEQTVVTIRGKKCILAFNQDMKQVCAYPIKPAPGTKRRGRPRMTEDEKAAAAVKKKHQHQKPVSESPLTMSSPSEKSSAAETLLELSNVGADGVRRSGRKRKKAKLFEEYEELEESDGDTKTTVVKPAKASEVNVSQPGVKRPKDQPDVKQEGEVSSVIVATQAQTVKRGRGRPRRYPASSQQQTTSIPAIMIPSVNGQTLVMAQGLQNIQGFHRELPNMNPKAITADTSNTLAVSVSMPSTLSVSVSTPNTSSVSVAKSCIADIAQSDNSVTFVTQSLALDTSAALNSSHITTSSMQGETISIVGDNTDLSDPTDTLDQTSTSLLTFITPTTSSVSDKFKDGHLIDGADNSIQSAVIQIPDNVLASLGFKKDPVKIGLKASEQELEKLKCPKCDFQGYYIQQYRSHIAAHGDDLQKCKCCSYLSLDSEELLQHFKEYHPRCICAECGYMAEHAYIIKRHMMRHDTHSCTCSLCGKVYKDMYILKMHVKMVHMPAEVLFECNVCSKKFTRKAHLKRHMRIHEPEKPYKCPVCDYRGCERSDISKHMLIHEEPRHTCERCGKTFRHIKNKELHVKRHYGQRDYKCGVCEFFGYTFTDIRKHIERKHQDMKSLICDKCNNHFQTELHLKEHYQTCSLIMMEQVLAVPDSEGSSSQTTIQIPTSLGLTHGQIFLDSQDITVDGQTISVSQHRGVSILVNGEPNLILPNAGREEEEEEDLEDEAGMSQTLEIISETISTDSGQQINIISHGGVLDQPVPQILAQHDSLPGSPDQILTSSSAVDILTDDGQILGQIVETARQASSDLSLTVTQSSDHLVDQSDQTFSLARQEATNQSTELIMHFSHVDSAMDELAEVKAEFLKSTDS